jgi:hypothetical protein
MNIKMIWNAAATTRNKTSVSGSILKESYVNSIKCEYEVPQRKITIAVHTPFTFTQLNNALASSSRKAFMLASSTRGSSFGHDGSPWLGIGLKFASPSHL